MQDKIWLSSPHMGGDEIKFINEAFETNWVAPLGPNVTGFENDLESFLGGESHVVALSSGTAAIHLSLILLGVCAGDEVICQSMTFSASANPISYLGATPIFIDSELETWNMCPKFLELAIKDRLSKGKRPKAIIPVHLYGMPAKIVEIRAIADYYQIPIIEDAAEALGSHIRNVNCGIFGDMACLSFNGNKIITTSGGGALVALDKVNAQKALFLATQARDTAHHYQHSQIGYNYRMSNICAGIGRGQMKVLNDRVSRRREIFNFYQQYLNEIPGFSFQLEPEGYFSNRWLSAVLINPYETGGISREDLRVALELENIECRPLWKPMHLQPIFSGSPYYGEGNSERLFDIGLCLPSGSNLNTENLNRVVDAIGKTLKLSF